jgi:general secretion pathway protein B
MSADDVPQSAAELAARIAAREQAAARVDPPAVVPPPSLPAASPTQALSLSDLSAEERKALPPLKMSMHLWNESPAQRLVIIDGQRLHEGDRVGNAVVTTILSNGVLLDWNGRQLRLPIR